MEDGALGSLRLLTPNWQCRLPGYAYEGDDPDGFMTMPEVVDFITGYAWTIRAPQCRRAPPWRRCAAAMVDTAWPETKTNGNA